MAHGAVHHWYTAWGGETLQALRRGREGLTRGRDLEKHCLTRFLKLEYAMAFFVAVDDQRQSSGLQLLSWLRRPIRERHCLWQLLQTKGVATMALFGFLRRTAG